MIKINFLKKSKSTNRSKSPRSSSSRSNQVRTRSRKTKSKTSAHLILLKVAAIGLTLALAQVLLSTRASFAKDTSIKAGAKAAGATIRPASGKLLNCSSPNSAPVYLGQSGKWTLNAEVVSEFKLTQVVLKNQRRNDLGSSMEMSVRDQRIASERVFLLKPDVHCNYEINFPREFSGEKSFQARLVQTCDNLFDGSAELSCNLNQ